MPDNFLILPASDVSNGRLTTLSNAIATSDLSLTVSGLSNGTELVVYQLGTGVSGTPQAISATGETHVFALIGQSNMIGRAGFDGGAKWPEGTMQIGRGGGNDGQIIPARNASDGPSVSEPLDHVNPQSGNMGLDIQFAIDYLSDKPDVSLVFVPCAQGGTGFSDNEWNPGDPLYNDALGRINAAMASSPGFLFKGFLWHQGETDVGIPGTYADLLDNMIVTIRTDVVAATTTTPFILGGLGSGNAAKDAITALIAETPNRVPHTSFVPAADVGMIDAHHFDAAGLRLLGSRYNSAIARAVANTPVSAVLPAAPSGLTGTAGDTQVMLTWTAPSDDGGTAIIDYVIERDSGAGFAPLSDGIGTGTTYTDTGLANGVAHMYRIRAVNAVGHGPASQSTSVTPTAATVGVEVEPGAVAHWLFGDDNPGNADLVSARPANGPAHAHSPGYITSPSGIQQGMDTGIAEADVQTTCFVFQLASTTNCIIGGTLEAPGGDLSTGVSPFTNAPSGIWTNMRGGWGNATVSTTSALDAGFAFVAISKNVTTGEYVLFVGDQAGSHVVSGLSSQTTSARTIGIGSLYFDRSNFNGQISTAETIIFDSAKTESEIAAIYERSRTRLGARNVTVL